MKNIEFNFIEEYKIDIDNFNTLNDIQKKQLISCVPLYLIEEDVKNMDTSDITNLFREENGGWAEAFFYNIINNDTNEIAFDFWMFNEESGVIFEHNTTNNIEIYMSDYKFEMANSNQFNQKLPNDFTDILEKSYSS